MPAAEKLQLNASTSPDLLRGIVYNLKVRESSLT